MAIKAFFMFTRCDCEIFQVSKETSATHFEAAGRFELWMAFGGYHGRRIIEGYTQIITLSFIMR